MKFCLVFFLFLVGFEAFSQEAPTAKLQVFQTFYSGDENKTFDSDNKGMGAEILLSSKAPIFNYYSKVFSKSLYIFKYDQWMILNIRNVIM